MTENVSVYRDVLDASAAAIRAVYPMLDEETQAIVEDALTDRHRLAIIADSTGLLMVLLDETTGQTGPVLASVNARTGREKLYALRRETQ